MAVDESTYFDNSDDFVEFLQGSLIPDLRSSGMDATAQDFAEAIFWIKYYKDKAEAPNDG